MRALLIPKSAPYDICRYLVYFSGRKLHYPVGPNASQRPGTVDAVNADAQSHRLIWPVHIVENNLH